MSQVSLDLPTSWRLPIAVKIGDALNRGQSRDRPNFVFFFLWRSLSNCHSLSKPVFCCRCIFFFFFAENRKCWFSLNRRPGSVRGWASRPTCQLPGVWSCDLRRGRPSHVQIQVVTIQSYSGVEKCDLEPCFALNNRCSLPTVTQTKFRCLTTDSYLGLLLCPGVT